VSGPAEPGRVLALDYGAARCGCAVSDPTGTLASPLEPILRPATRKGIRRVVLLAEELQVRRIVVGLPLSLSGADSAQTVETREWAQRLSDLVAPVAIELLDERFTTKLAAQAGGKASEDSRAAAVLLDDWLARQRP
jgi:putative Holliday junction resolvase